MHSLWTILNMKWQDRVSNLQVLDMAESTSIEAMILKSRLRWVGHVIRMADNRLPTQLIFVWGARFWEAKARQACQEIQRLRKGQSKPCGNYLPPRSLSPALMTGLDGEPSPDTPWIHSRRGAAHRSRRSGREERRRLMLPAVPVSSHARTVPGPASLGLDSTATSVPMADGSRAEERHHRF